MNSDFDAVYMENYRRLFRVASKMLGDSDASRDVIQEVFLAYYQASNEKREVLNTKSWLLRATINKSIDFLERKKKFTGIESLMADSDDSASSDRKAERAMINSALEKLDSRDKSLIILYSEGYSYKEMAEIAGIRCSSVGKLLARSLEKFKIMMNDKI